MEWHMLCAGPPDHRWRGVSEEEYSSARATFRQELIGTVENFRAGNYLGKIIRDPLPASLWDKNLLEGGARAGIPIA